MRSRLFRLGLALVGLLALSTVSFYGQEPRQAAAPLSEERLLAVMHSISSHTLLDYVKELASEKYQGRLTGTPTYDAAAQWTIRLLENWKIKPAGDKGTYLQQFPDPYTLVLPGAELSMSIPVGNQATITKPYVYEQDFFPGSTSDSGTVTAEVVYVGYGATAPELGYDDYQGVDVKGKIVLMEPEVPVSPDKEPDLFKKWRPYSFHDYKVKNALGHGAAGMVYNYHIVNPNCAFLKGFVLTYVGRAVVDDIFAGTGKNHDDLVKSIRANRKSVSFATGKVMRIKNVTVHHPEGVGANVIGYLEGSDLALKTETIIVGAHLDHLGMNDQLMPGANDDASGVAVTLGVAEALATSAVPLRRSVLFILFGAEEQGVKGSEYYVAHPEVPNDHVKGFINLESVGRGERITAGAGGKDNERLWEYFDRNNRKYIHRPVSMRFSANLGRPRQDAAHFMWAGIPTLSFGTGGSKPLPFATYHTTKDTPEIITPEIMEDLARLVFLSVVEMANGRATETRTEFSGTWKLNLQRSDFASEVPPISKIQTVAQSDSLLKVSIREVTKQGEVAGDASYRTDGTQSTNDVLGNPMKATITWDGPTLVMRTWGTFGGSDITLVDRWRLSEDAKTLTIERHFEGHGQTSDQKLVFDRQ